MYIILYNKSHIIEKIDKSLVVSEEKSALTKVPVKLYTYRTNTKFAKSHICNTARSFNYLV